MKRTYGTCVFHVYPTVFLQNTNALAGLLRRRRKQFICTVQPILKDSFSLNNHRWNEP